MKLQANWTAKSLTLLDWLKTNGINYPALCNAINARLDKVEYTVNGAAKVAKAKETKHGLKWTAQQGFQALEAIAEADITCKVYNLDIDIAKAEKAMGWAVGFALKPESDVVDWLTKFKVKKTESKPSE